MTLDLLCIKNGEISHSTCVDMEKLKEFQKIHDIHIDKPSRDPIHGHTYRFLYTPTSIGTEVDIICECGKKQDITDYSSF